jgi:6-pyruvoyltetrahydropterin/6-carboxytetrahydropterin synthase
MYSVTKRFTFEAAHRLMHHAGECRRLHGHSYKVDVTLECERVDDHGMTIDFHDFDGIKARIDQFDHALLLHTNDPLVHLLYESEHRVRAFAGDPTAETLAFEIARAVIINLALKDPAKEIVRSVFVDVWETEKCHAGYRTQV